MKTRYLCALASLLLVLGQVSGFHVKQLHPHTSLFRRRVTYPYNDNVAPLKSSSYFDGGMRRSIRDGEEGGRLPPDSYSAGPLSKARVPSDKNMWREESTALIQGNTLRTWPLSTSYTDMIQVSLATEGRPLNANIEMWQGPDYTPSHMKVYIEDGNLRPLNAVLLTPSASNTVAIYNTGNLEFPFYATVEEKIEPGLSRASENPFEWSTPATVQGGALVTYPFDPAVQSVQVMLNTDGRNLKARIELIQGPNNDKQIVEFYSSDGDKRPIYLILETPGTGNVVRIINQNPVEFPLTAFVGPYEVDARRAQE